MSNYPPGAMYGTPVKGGPYIAWQTSLWRRWKFESNSDMKIKGSTPRWRVDLHVHTRRYSPCAELLDPDLLPTVMVERGLHGLVITEHDHLWTPEEIGVLNSKLDDARIYSGVEISSRNGHFVVIGLDHLDGLKPGVSIRNIVEVARAQGAAVIWAHPQLAYGQVLQPLKVGDMSAGIDAVEVASTMTVGLEAAKARRYARNLGCGTVSGSDAHCLDQVGKTYTLFDHIPADEKELAAAICSGCYTMV